MKKLGPGKDELIASEEVQDDMLASGGACAINCGNLGRVRPTASDRANPLDDFLC